MITFTTNDTITSRNTTIRITCNNPYISNVILKTRGEEKVLFQDEIFTFNMVSNLRARRITPPLFSQLLSNLSSNILITFKEREYVVGKNTIFTFNKEGYQLKPMMLHVGRSTTSLRATKIVINPELFEIDSSFFKMFQVILETGVDIELTRTIEEKYYHTVDLPKFGSISEAKKYVEKAKEKAMKELSKLETI